MCYIIKEKSEDISWEVLAKLQFRAHEHNHKLGIDMHCSHLTGNELKEALKSGTTYVAINSVGEPKGMLSVVVKQVDRWWHKGKAGYVCYVAVAPECQGCGLYRKLSTIAFKNMIDANIEVVYLDTHFANLSAQKAYIKDGFLKVRFSPGGYNYYAVEMAKWFNGKGKSSLICGLMFLLTEMVARILYKPGKKRRF